MADHGEFREEIVLDEHPHSYDRTEPKGNLIFVFGALTVIFVLLSAIAIQYYYDRVYEEQVYEKVLAPENYVLKDLRTKEDQELHSYAYIDRDTGKVRLSIDRAIELLAQEAKTGQLKYPTASYRIKTPEELAGSAPAVSQPGAAAATGTQQQGVGSNPNVQQPTPEQKPSAGHK